MKTQPLVSVIMITYNHEHYIKEAIKGVFLQKTNFPIELIIANDCSPDNTTDTVKKMLHHMPKHITVKYTEHKKNIGMMANHHWALNQAKGKYIAICDGDDYWIDENKLQNQFDFMESNAEYAICCHNFKILNGNKIQEHSFFDDLKLKDTYDIVDLSENNIIPTLSAFFINKKINFPKWTKSAPLGDLILFLNIAQYGKIKFFNKKWAVYRQNVGVWHKNKNQYLKMIELYENLANDFKENKKVKDNLKTLQKKNIKAYLKQLPFLTSINNKYFKELSFVDKFKIFIQNII